MDEYTARRKAVLDDKRRSIAEEENFSVILRRVFSADEGYAVLQWLLSDICGFWRGELAGMGDSAIGKFDAGRTLFNAVTMADVAIASRLLADRRALAESARAQDKLAIENEEKKL
jgi:hypothetical protein